jgi:periplasmic protein CpxP/Spy
MNGVMSKIKFLSMAVAGLLALNLAIIGAIFLKESRLPPPGERQDKQLPKHIIIEKLHFDRQQIIEYEELIKVHRSNKDASNQMIHDLKNQLYSSVSSGSDSTRDSLIQLILEEQKKLELINYSHFSDIKMLCHPDQLKAFDDLSKKMLDIFSGMKSN